MRRAKKSGQRFLCFSIAASTFVLSITNCAHASSNEIGLGFGIARFYSSRGNQTEGNQLLYGSLHIDRIIHNRFFIGVMADLTFNFCPVCDNSPDDELKTISMVSGPVFELRPFIFQFGAGIGAAIGADGIFEDGEEIARKFSSINIPIISNASYRLEFQKLEFGIGIGIKYHLNFKNNTLVSSIPLTITF